MHTQEGFVTSYKPHKMEEDGYNRMFRIRGFYSQIHVLYFLSNPEKFNRFSFPSDAKFIRFIITVEVLLFWLSFLHQKMSNLLVFSASLQQHRFCISLDCPILEEEINPNLIQQAPC